MYGENMKCRVLIFYTFCGLKVKSVIRTVHTAKPILSKKGEGQNCGLIYPETATLEY